MSNEKLKMKNDCVRLGRTLSYNVPRAHTHFTFLILHFSLLLAFLRFAQPAQAMGSAPAKPQPKYKLEVLKLEVVRGGTAEAAHKPKRGAL